MEERSTGAVFAESVARGAGWALGAALMGAGLAALAGAFGVRIPGR